MCILLKQRLAALVFVAAFSTVLAVPDFQTVMYFRSKAAYGTPSYIAEPLQGLVNVSTTKAMPPIVVEIRTNTWLKTKGLDKSMDGKTVEVSTAPLSLQMTGNSVEISEGEALFTSLQITESPATACYLVFRIPGENVTELESGPLNFLDDSAGNLLERVASISFRSYGFFFYEGQSRKVPIGVSIPEFWVVAKNALGYPISLGAASPTLELKVTTSVGSFTKATSFFAKQLVDVATLTYVPSSASDRPVFTFTVTTAGSTFTTRTGALTVTAAGARSTFINFVPSSSFFAYENIGNTAVLGLAMPPIVIQLYTSSMESDVSNTGLVIQATTEQGTLEGAEALVVRGVATFSNLAFVGTAPRSSVITFTAGTQGGLPVQQYSLSSGAVSVAITAIKAKHFSFAQSSFIQSTEQRSVRLDTATGTFVIPSIIVQMKDSAYQIDSSVNNLAVTLNVDPQSISVSSPDTIMTSGIASYASLTFSNARAAGVTITVAEKYPTGARSSLSSALINVIVDPLGEGTDRQSNQLTEFERCRATGQDCIFSLEFAGSSMSFIFAEGQELYTSVGGTLPEIRIFLNDQFGKTKEMTASLVPVVVAYTGDDPQGETLLETGGAANHGTWQDGTYIFSCLQFKEQPEGLVRIQFMAIDSKAAAYSGINQLRTGFVTVTSSVTANYGLRFSSTNSLFIYPGQPSSAVLNVALPPITIELVDSLYVADTSNNDVVIVATTSSGQLDANGAREIVTKGKAVFSTLKFISIGDEPILTFKAQSALQPVGGKSITTGSLTLTTLPIASFEIAFMSSTDGNNDVTHEFQAFTFAKLSDVKVHTVVMVRDSAHQYESSAAASVEIRESCDQASIIDTTLQSIAVGGRTANFTTTFSRYWDGYLNSDIYITFTVQGGGNALLVGKSVTVGPIKVLERSGTAKCADLVANPIVVMEFRISVAEFTAAADDIKSKVAFLVGAEANRVKFANIRKVRGVDHSTVAHWTGTKVDVSFLDPLTTSTNRKSSSQLASELAKLNLACQSGSDLGLETLYLLAQDNDCDADAFLASLNESAVCAATGVIPLCQCYEAGVMHSWGMNCVDESGLEDEYRDLCGLLSACAEAETNDVCEDFYSRQPLDWLKYLWWSLAVVVPAGVMVLVLKRYGIICQQTHQSNTLRASLMTE